MRKWRFKVGMVRLSCALSVRMELKGFFVLEFEEGVQNLSCAAFSVVSLIRILQMFVVLLNLRDCWGVLLYLPTTEDVSAASDRAL
jgi:hypothetical protein